MLVGADAYNELLSVSNTEALLEKQLKSAGIDRAKLFSQLSPLFDDSEGRKSCPYAVYLIRRHYEFKPGEPMVGTDCGTKPSTESSSYSLRFEAIWAMSRCVHCSSLGLSN